MDLRIWLEAALTSALLVLGLCVATGIVHKRLRVSTWAPVLLVIVGLTAWAAPMLQVRSDATAPRSDEPLRERTHGYATSDTCQACHPDQYASWDRSYHSSMTEVATDETVRAPFESVLRFGSTYRVEKRGPDQFWVVTDDPSWRNEGEPEGQPVERRIAFVTGSHHQQLYWFATERGRTLGRLPFYYRFESERWVPFHSALLIQAHTKPEPSGIWNTNCLRCHTTHSRPRDGHKTAMDTRVAELGIACESCHGPGTEHVTANRNPARRYAAHLSGNPDRERDTTITNPGRLTAARETDVCGQCHSVHTYHSEAAIREWIDTGIPFRPGDDLRTFRYVFDPPNDLDAAPVRRVVGTHTTFIEDRFWPDGEVSVSGREYNGVVTSPCFAGGEYSCGTCHTMHWQASMEQPIDTWANDQLRDEARGDETCLSCHPQLANDIPAHTHHAAESSGSRCYNCHMPNTAYGLTYATRSHRVTVPDVATALATGRPDACSLCHLDQPLAWSARHLEQWYGRTAPDLTRHPEHQQFGAGLLWGLRGDAGQRVIITWHLGWEAARKASGTDWSVPLLSQLLLDPYEVVRLGALRALHSHPDMADQPEMDYLAVPKVRRRGRANALAQWESLADERSDLPRERVLLEADGSLDKRQFKRFLSERNDRRVFRAE